MTESCLCLRLPLHTIISLTGVLQHLIRGSEASAERNGREMLIIRPCYLEKPGLAIQENQQDGALLLSGSNSKQTLNLVSRGEEAQLADSTDPLV